MDATLCHKILTLFWSRLHPKNLRQLRNSALSADIFNAIFV